MADGEEPGKLRKADLAVVDAVTGPKAMAHRDAAGQAFSDGDYVKAASEISQAFSSAVQYGSKQAATGATIGVGNIGAISGMREIYASEASEVGAPGASPAIPSVPDKSSVKKV